MDHPAGRLTALARAIDVRVPSNRFVLLASALAAAIGLVATLATSSDATVLDAVGRGLRYGVGAFLAWAIGRELDPDQPRAAALAVLVYLPAMALGTPALAALAAVLLAARVTLRSTGASPTIPDLVALVVLAGVAASTAAGLVAAFGLAYAIHADRHLPRPAPDRPHEIAALATAVVALAVTVVTASSLTGWRGLGVGEVVWLVLVVAAVWRLPRPVTLTTTDDRGARTLERQRLVHARRLVVVTLGAAVVWAGGDAVPALAPAGAALIGTAVATSRVTRPRTLARRAEPPAGAA